MVKMPTTDRNSQAQLDLEATEQEIERLVKEFKDRLADIRRRANEIYIEDLRRSIQQS